MAPERRWFRRTANLWILEASDPPFNTQSFHECQTDGELLEKFAHGNWCKLFHFDAQGNLEHATESLLSGIEPSGSPMMSEAEFDRLRSRLLVERAARRTADRTESLESVNLEGLLPSVSDHYLDAYIAKVAGKAMSSTAVGRLSDRMTRS